MGRSLLMIVSQGIRSKLLMFPITGEQADRQEEGPRRRQQVRPEEEEEGQETVAVCPSVLSPSRRHGVAVVSRRHGVAVVSRRHGGPQSAEVMGGPRSAWSQSTPARRGGRSGGVGECDITSSLFV